MDEFTAKIGAGVGALIALALISLCLPNDTMGMAACGIKWLLAVPVGYFVGGVAGMFLR
ncbi:hypothetical protein ACM64Y_01875 [Novispirillum sp. DQ9]|uniref:hypothetical protein n=1 Tax=Novispirillum sp. DQ9 TaxID=3398612 RepID=UPI003C7DBD79